MYYTVYKITNLINNKIYIGVHKTADINDDYMGSGTVLTKAQKKYGIKNFTKEILHVFDNAEDMYAKEAEIVDADFIAEANTYNLKVGGLGGFDYINKNGKLANLRKNPEWNAEFSKAVKNGLQTYYKQGNAGNFLGKCHTVETKRKISEAAAKSQAGKGNSQYGTRWIHSPELKISKKIKKNDPLPDGWLEGRKMKF